MKIDKIKDRMETLGARMNERLENIREDVGNDVSYKEIVDYLDNIEEDDEESKEGIKRRIKDVFDDN